MTEAQLKEWKSQAEKAGLLEEYEYHLGAVQNPLPFQMWRMKFAALERLQAIPENDPRYFARETFDREIRLCNELGY